MKIYRTSKYQYDDKIVEVTIWEDRSTTVKELPVGEKTNEVKSSK